MTRRVKFSFKDKFRILTTMPPPGVESAAEVVQERLLDDDTDKLPSATTTSEKQQSSGVGGGPKEDKKMAAASKELSPEQKEKEATSSSSDANGSSIGSTIYSLVKKVALVGGIYLVGYMGWSVAWLIVPVIFSVAREEWRKSSELRRSIAKASATVDEKDVILARISDLPAWVYFPDIERCEWLNRVLKQVWPNANHFAKSLLKDTIEPNVQKALAGYKLNNFRFDRVVLGTIPPRIGGIKVYDKNVSRNEIIMDLDLFYASDCDINFSLGGMRGGIKDFSIHGMMRVIMKPLITKMPLVGGLQVFFLNNPNIDFNLVGVVDLLDMPGLSDMLRKIIVEQVASIMVLPNKLPITLSDDVPAHTLKMPEPEGVLRIHVVEAKNLMKKDITVLGKGKSDPYAILTVGAQQFRTQTIDNTVDPKWDYWCEAIVLESGQLLNVELFDKDDTSDDEFLGRATVEISSVVKKGEIDTWITLENAKHGLVHLRMSWMALSAVRSDLGMALHETQMLRVTSMNTALVTVFIDSAKNLPQARPQSNPDPMLYVSVGKKQEQTSVQMRTNEPVWEQGFTFLVGNPENDTLQLRIVDQKTEKEIGRLTYILSGLLDKTNMEIMAEPFHLQKSGPESRLTMSLQLRIFKKAFDGAVDHDESSGVTGSLDGSSLLSRSTSTNASEADGVSAGGAVGPLKKQDSRLSTTASEATIAEETLSASSMSGLSSTPLAPMMPGSGGGSGDHELVRRTSSQVSAAGVHGLGRIQLTIRHSVQRQRLIVIVHKIVNIPQKDPSSIPDPYVKLYLLPSRSKESKRKTNVVKDNCNPVYDATFEYIISSAEMLNTDLEVTVATQKGFLSSPVIGMVKVSLSEPEIGQQGVTTWYDLTPEQE